MLADDVLQPMYDLAYFLHPDPAVALTVTLDAADRLALLRRLREHSIGHAWRRLPDAWLPQYCVYVVSDRPGRAHERPRPHRTPRARPTRDDYLVRYLKCLGWWIMTSRPVMWPWCCVASSTAIRRVTSCGWPPALCDPHRIHRLRVRLTQQLQARFPRAHLFEVDHGTRSTSVPTAHDRRLVQRALALFTPWGAAHVPAPALDQSLLETHFGRASAYSDGDRIHALINPADAGLSRLIREYNQQFSPGIRSASPSRTPCWRSRALPRNDTGRPAGPAMRLCAMWRARHEFTHQRPKGASHAVASPCTPEA